MSDRIFSKVELSSDRSSRNLAAWSLLAAIGLWAVLAEPFFAGRIYTADDLGAFHLPIRAFYAAQLADGQPYDWMPQLFSGFYLTGEGQGGTYHPLHQLLYRLLPLHAALGWEYLLPYPSMMLGLWLLLKRRLGRNDAAALGAMLFAFSSFNLLHFVHPNAVAVIAHIPWLLWAIDVAMVDSRPRRVALATVLIALLTGSQLLLGYPQFVWFSLVAEGAYVLFLQTAHRYAPRTGCDLHVTCDDCAGCTGHTWSCVAVATGIGLLIGGVQLLPSLDAWRHSARLSASPGYPFWGSLDPLNVLQLLAPYLFASRVVGDSVHEYGMYAGAVPLMLIVWLVARRNELGCLSRLAWATLGFALLMLVLSFGYYGYLYRVVTWLPVLRSFRFPCRYLVLFQLAVAVLAAIGFVLLVRQGDRARRLRAKGRQTIGAGPSLWRDFEPLWGTAALSAAIAVVGVTLHREPYIASIPAILAGPALIMIAAVLIALAARGYSAALIGLIVFAALDLGFYGLSYSVYPKNSTLDAYVATAIAPPGNPDGRVVGSLFHVDEPGLRTGDLMILRGWRRADGYAGLEPARQLDYRLLPALRVAGVRWVKRNASTIEIAGLQPRSDRWLEVPDPLPRVRLVSQTRTTTDPAGEIARIRPDATALCEVPLALPASTPGTAVLAAERPGQLAIDIDCPAPQLLVVAESYHPDWQAAIDGHPCKAYRINGDFLGCIVGPGKQQVVLTFRPSSLRRGWLASCIGLGLLPVFAFGVITGVPSPFQRPPKNPDSPVSSQKSTLPSGEG